MLISNDIKVHQLSYAKNIIKQKTPKCKQKDTHYSLTFVSCCILTCSTIHSSPSRFTCKACSNLHVTCVVFTVAWTRQVAVVTIYFMFTIQTCSTLYVTCVIFTGVRARTVTGATKNSASFTTYIDL